MKKKVAEPRKIMAGANKTNRRKTYNRENIRKNDGNTFNNNDKGKAGRIVVVVV